MHLVVEARGFGKRLWPRRLKQGAECLRSEGWEMDIGGPAIAGNFFWDSESGASKLVRPSSRVARPRRRLYLKLQS